MAKVAQWGKTTFGVGDTIRIQYQIKEGDKLRLQPFEGVVISIRGSGPSKTFTVRRIGVDRVGIERIFPLNSPWIKELTVVRHPRRRLRAKLYYLRQANGKRTIRL